MKSFLTIILSILLSFTRGCGVQVPAGTEYICRVVTGISIQYEDDGDVTQRRYTDQHKMNKTLMYLRWLEPWGAPSGDAGTMDGPTYQILLTLSDGTTRRYEQKGNRFLSIDHAPWIEIDPEKAIHLPLLIAAIPSDGPPQ